MMDYSQFETTAAIPEASAMIQTFRAIGYSVEAAIADIIDNSISAGAKKIWVDYDWKGPLTTISIVDDGKGMNNDELINAMRPGSKNPLDVREEKDLGRFGLGLKTASFSQCKKFSVISKDQTGGVSWWCWDLDYVRQVKSWTLLRYYPDAKFLQQIAKVLTGTAVIWWDIDRLTKDSQEDDADSMDNFMKKMDGVKKHLSMVFHRFISRGVKIYFKGREVEPWDPFMIGIGGLQPKSDVYLDDRQIFLKGYVLPHRSKLSPEQYDYGKGPKDSWTAHQGFYVYRNQRLLVAGDWLGIGSFKKEVHYDLCRILIELPNNADAEWQIDIKKSLARPPARLLEQILSAARNARSQAVEVYRHRGKVIRRQFSRDEDQFLWQEYRRNEKRFYKLNRVHPIIKQLLENSSPYRSEIEKALRFIEETIPIPLITLKENEAEITHGQPFEGTNHELILATMKAMYRNLINQNKTDDQAKGIILSIEPFNFYPQYVEYLNANDDNK
ncbi:MAG: ATP-binding protein [Chloracidobacterium sp.]|nr:ATP-binding protein [Chloracidobacterium sp.]